MALDKTWAIKTVFYDYIVIMRLPTDLLHSPNEIIQSDVLLHCIMIWHSSPVVSVYYTINILSTLNISCKKKKHYQLLEVPEAETVPKYLILLQFIWHMNATSLLCTFLSFTSSLLSLLGSVYDLVCILDQRVSWCLSLFNSRNLTHTFLYL